MDLLKPSAKNITALTPLIFLETAATVYGDSVSIVYNAISYTWSDTYQRCLQLASSMTDAGIKKNDVVSVIAPNIPAIYELHFAVPMAGAVLNCVNTRLDAHSIAVILHHAESKLIFVDLLSLSLVEESLQKLPQGTSRPSIVLIGDGSIHGEYEATSSRVCYESMVQKGDPAFKWIRPGSEWDPMVLNYTSGTTSSPKGVVHCHRGIYVMTLASLVDWFMPNQAVYLWTLPMFHANGWSFPWGMAAVGGTNVCLRKVDSREIFKAITQRHVTHMCGAPVVLNMLSNSPEAKPLPSPVRLLTAGASPPAEVLRRTESLGFIVSHGYGLTEAAGIVVSCAWKEKWNNLPASKRAALKARQGVRTPATTEMDVVDPRNGKSLDRDGSSLGEIVIRSGSIMLGYLKDPMGTAKVLTDDGWFFTGDVGVIHPDGYLEIKDRSKDVIISGGENLSSVEVESVLYGHMAVNEAAVVARADDFWGETPCAFVSLKPGVVDAPTEKDIVEFCVKRLPRYMVPKTVVFKADLPRTSTGKIQKFRLREEAKSMGPIKTSRL